MDAQNIIELGKSFEEAKKIKVEIREGKLEKATLEKNIIILKRANAEEQTEYEQNKKGRDEQISLLKNNIKLLEVKRANLATSTVPEIRRLEAILIELAKTETDIKREQNELVAKTDTLNKGESKLEDKKKILIQIYELVKRL
jgi:hypothetical protein